MPAGDRYAPVSCDVHDVLEAAATRRSVVRIVFVDTAGRASGCEARIVDLVTRAGGEYMVLDGGMEVRLDRIVSVDGVPLPAASTASTGD